MHIDFAFWFPLAPTMFVPTEYICNKSNFWFLSETLEIKYKDIEH